MKTLIYAGLTAISLSLATPAVLADHQQHHHKEGVVVKKGPFGVKVVKPVKKVGFSHGAGVKVSPFGVKVVKPQPVVKVSPFGVKVAKPLPDYYEKTVIAVDAFGRKSQKIVLVDVHGQPVNTRGKVYPAGTFKPYVAPKPVYYERTLYFKDRFGQTYAKSFVVDADGRPVDIQKTAFAVGSLQPYPFN